uniref:Uncharacterized protein n=1 Tax=Anguilla anguilla TaxID=7936 RepID=A0A0E9RIS6_ANGAN
MQLQSSDIMPSDVVRVLFVKNTFYFLVSDFFL